MMKTHRKNLTTLMKRGVAALLSGMMLTALVLPAGPFTLTAKAAGDGMTVTLQDTSVSMHFHAYDMDGNAIDSELNGRYYDLVNFNRDNADDGNGYKSIFETGLRNVGLYQVNENGYGYTFAYAQMDGKDTIGIQFKDYKGFRIAPDGNTDNDTASARKGTAEIALYYEKDPNIIVNNVYVGSETLDVNTYVDVEKLKEAVKDNLRENAGKRVSFADYLKGNLYTFSHVTINGSGDYQDFAPAEYFGSDVRIDYHVTKSWETPVTRVHYVNEKGEKLSTSAPKELTYGFDDHVYFTEGSTYVPNIEGYYFTGAVFTGGFNEKLNTNLDDRSEDNIYNFLNQNHQAIGEAGASNRDQGYNIRLVTEMESRLVNENQVKILYRNTDMSGATAVNEQVEITASQFDFYPVLSGTPEYVAGGRGYLKLYNEKTGTTRYGFRGIYEHNTFSRIASDGGDLFITYQTNPVNGVYKFDASKVETPAVELDHYKTVIQDPEDAGDKALYDLNLTIQSKHLNKVAMPIDLLFVLDASGSMKSPLGQVDGAPIRMNALQEAVKDLVEDMNKMHDNKDIDIRYAAVYFETFAGNGDGKTAATTKDDDIRTFSHWNNIEITNKITSEVKGRGTNYQSAFHEAKEIFDAAKDNNAKKVIIFVTDGLPTKSLTFRAAGGGNTVGYTTRIRDDIIKELQTLEVDAFYTVGIELSRTEAISYNYTPWMSTDYMPWWTDTIWQPNNQGGGEWISNPQRHDFRIDNITNPLRPSTTGEDFLKELVNYVKADEKPDPYFVDDREGLVQAFEGIKSKLYGNQFGQFDIYDTLSEYADAHLGVSGNKVTGDAARESSREGQELVSKFGITVTRTSDISLEAMMSGITPSSVKLLATTDNEVASAFVYDDGKEHTGENEGFNTDNSVTLTFHDKEYDKDYTLIATVNTDRNEDGSYGTNYGKIHLDFGDEYILNPNYEFKVTLAIEPSEKAYRLHAGNQHDENAASAYEIDYAVNGSKVPVGDNINYSTGTHAGEEGFWSNAEEGDHTSAKATFIKESYQGFGEGSGSDLEDVQNGVVYYDRPVIQVEDAKVHVKKIWTDRDGNEDKDMEDLYPEEGITLYVKEVTAWDEDGSPSAWTDVKDSKGNVLYPDGITLDGIVDDVETKPWEADFTRLPLFKDKSATDARKVKVEYTVVENPEDLLYYVYDRTEKAEDDLATTTNPNLQSLRVYNKRITTMLDVIKDIKGGMGERDYGFTFEVQFSWADAGVLPVGLEDGKEESDKTFTDKEIIDRLWIYKGKTTDKGESVLSIGNVLVKEDWEKEGILYKGNGRFEFKLSDDEMVRFDRIPRDIHFKVTEKRSDVFEQQFGTVGHIRTNLKDKWETIGEHVLNGKPGDYTTFKEDNISETIVTEDLYEVKVRVTNNKDIVRTGLTLQTLPFLLMVIFAIGAIGAFVVITVRRRKLNVED